MMRQAAPTKAARLRTLVLGGAAILAILAYGAWLKHGPDKVAEATALPEAVLPAILQAPEPPPGPAVIEPAPPAFDPRAIEEMVQAMFEERAPGYEEDLGELADLASPFLDYARDRLTIDLPAHGPKEPEGRKSPLVFGSAPKLAFTPNPQYSALRGDAWLVSLNHDVIADNPGIATATVIEGTYRGARVVCDYRPVTRYSDETLFMSCDEIQIGGVAHRINAQARPQGELDPNYGPLFAVSALGEAGNIAIDAATDAADDIARDAVRAGDRTRGDMQRQFATTTSVAPVFTVPKGTRFYVQLVEGASLR